MKFLITGASGFIGKELLKNDYFKGHDLVLLYCHNKPCILESEHTTIHKVNLDIEEDLSQKVRGCDIVIHIAAKVHDYKHAEYNDYLNTNVLATKRLAEAAEVSGAKKFIFISTAKVVGDETFYPVSENFRCFPIDMYSKSKLQAEEFLISMSKLSRMKMVIIRPPLVYGFGVKANFRNLIKLVKSRLPLPFLSINNLRSFIFVGNLVDFIITCINHSEADNQIFFVSDDKDISTVELIQRLNKLLGFKSYLFFFSKEALMFFILFLGMQNQFKRLFGNFQIDITKAKRRLGWKPPYSVEYGLTETLNKIK